MDAQKSSINFIFSFSIFFHCHGNLNSQSLDQNLSCRKNRFSTDCVKQIRMLCFWYTKLYDLLKTDSLLFWPIRHKNKTNCDLVTWIFPRFDVHLIWVLIDWLYTSREFLLVYYVSKVSYLLAMTVWDSRRSFETARLPVVLIAYKIKGKIIYISSFLGKSHSHVEETSNLLVVVN